RLGQTDLLLLLEHIAIDNDAAQPIRSLYSLASSRRPRRAARWATWTTRYSRPASADSSAASTPGGVLYFLESGQCFHGLVHPADFGSLLACRLVHRRELPYLLHSPTRLLLRLGAEDGVYPCGLISNRYRPPVFYEPARSVMSMFREAVPHLSEGPGAAAARLQPDAGEQRHRRGVDLWPAPGPTWPACSACTLRTPMECWRWLASSASQPMRTWLPGSRLEANLKPSCSPLQDDRRSGRLGTAGHGWVTGLGFMALSTRLGAADQQGCLAAIVEDGLGVICSRQDMWSLLQSLNEAEDFVLPLDWLFLHDRREPMRSSSIRFVWRHLPGE
uniref:DUF3480 domain-containing protein n=1 Tax=Macrostomum lignano TaxID=282301 RepID=A0A1I8IHQ4_9PLAT